MQGKEDLDFMDSAHRLEHRLSALMARSGVTATRVALGVIFLWFGILKFLPTTTPIDVLAERTLTMITFHQFTAEHRLHVLTVWECVIGIGLLSGRFLRFTCASPKLHPAKKLNRRLDILTVKSRLDLPTRASWKAMKTQADGILARHSPARPVLRPD